jgi:hypothetical protein
MPQKGQGTSTAREAPSDVLMRPASQSGIRTVSSLPSPAGPGNYPAIPVNSSQEPFSHHKPHPHAAPRACSADLDPFDHVGSQPPSLCPTTSATLYPGARMTLELSREIEAQLTETAQSQGVSVSQYIERLVAETNLRHAQVSAFRAAIAERMASLEAGDSAAESIDGEEVMARLIADLSSR